MADSVERRQRNPDRAARLLLHSLFICITATLGFGAPLQATSLSSEEYQFTLDVPDGFIRLPDSKQAIYAFATSDPADGVPDVVVLIQSMRGTIGREHPKLPSMAAPNARLTSMRWKDFDVDVLSLPTTVGDLQFASRAAQLPIEGRAVQIIVLSPLGKEANADLALAAFVNGLDGPSSWRSPYEQGRQGTFSAFAVLCACVGIFIMFHFSKRRPGAAAATSSMGIAAGVTTSAFPSFAASAAPTGDTDRTRNRRALRPAAWTSLVILLLFGVGGVAFLLLGGGRVSGGYDLADRITDLLMGVARLSGTCALIAYVIARLVIRIRSGHAMVMPTRPASEVWTPPRTLGDAAANLENIEE